MVVQFSSPTISRTSRPVSKVPQKVSNNNLVRSVPGVGAVSMRGSAIPQSRPQEQEVATPLERYQETLKRRITEGQQHTDDLKRRTQQRTAFEQQFALKNQKSGWAQGPVQQNYQQQNYKSGGSGAWGNFRNGQIPPNAMKQIAPGHFMRADAAAQFTRMNAAFRQAFGRNISITDSYRPYAVQVRLKQTKPGLAATPGTSNHGWGLALDLGGGINRWGTRENAWINRYGRQFGFHPLGGQKGKIEPWHWEFRR